MRRNLALLSLCAVCMLAATTATAEVRPDGSLGYLTGPADGAPLDIARDYLSSNLDALGLVAGDLDGVIVTSQHTARHNGLTHIYLRQTIDGVQVVNANGSIHVAADGRILRLNENFVSGLAGKIDAVSPQISAEEAIRAGAQHVGLPREAVMEIIAAETGADLARFFRAGDLSLDDIPVRLRYFQTQTGDAVRLAWEVLFRQPNGRHWWNLWVAADNGRVLSQSDWMDEDSYNVFAYPKESPLDGPQTIEVDPAHPIASPFGWHDTDGAAGAEFTDTRGNNVDAHDDVDGNNVPGIRADGGPSLDFDFPFDPDLPPADNLEQAIVNLFYWNNITHDLLYLYGFDEGAGNFQVTNYTGDGTGNDPVQADAQDGSGFNNATFFTPPDNDSSGLGADPRMTMFIWLGPPTLIVNSPPSIAGEYLAGGAEFGERFDTIGLTEDLELVDDGTGLPTEGCNDLVGFTPGRVAVIDRGSCEFGQKVLNAEEAGAVAAIVINNAGDGVLTMGAGQVGNQVTIPSLFIGQTDGEAIKNELGGGVNATMLRLLDDRDSDNDNGVIAHEYAHGWSNRLTGGRLNANCLNNSEQMGEGWSDLLGLFMSAVETDTGEQARGIGNYLIFADEDGPGIRNFPYSTDLAINPQTYQDINTTNVPHGVGEIWAAMVWEMYWSLTDLHGWGDVFTEPTSGPGIALQLVHDGMTLQPCSPTFQSGRDAILDADLANSGGAHECLIWEAFAKRGMGFSADAGGPFNTDGTEAFDLPPQCEQTGINVSLSGTCPGPMTVEVTGLTPGATVGVGLSQNPGTFNLPNGPCAGTEMTLGLPLRAARFLTADGTGTVSFDAAPGDDACSSAIQAVDFGTCDVSDVIFVP